MNIDFLVGPDGLHSTYSDDKLECFDVLGNDKRFMRIEEAVDDSENYGILKGRFKITILDHKTKLSELTCSKIRILHILYGEIFVYIGAFIKKTRKTPSNIIDKNNKRIMKYMLTKGGQVNGRK